MPAQRKKRDLPSRLCATCGRPFVWRKKWEKVWDEVKYCSDRCRRQRTSQAASLQSQRACSSSER